METATVQTYYLQVGRMAKTSADEYFLTVGYIMQHIATDSRV